MKTKLTKRSQTDGTLVTISLKQFDNSGLRLPLGAFYVGDEVTVVIEGVPTVCVLARPDSFDMPTVMTTHALPRFIRLPRVGHPVNVEVSEIR